MMKRLLCVLLVIVLLLGTVSCELFDWDIEETEPPFIVTEDTLAVVSMPGIARRSPREM